MIPKSSPGSVRGPRSVSCSNKRKRNAGRRMCSMRPHLSGAAARPAGRARLPAFHHGACGSDRTPPLNSSYALPETGLVRSGRYPLPAASVQRVLPRRPVIVPAGRLHPEPPGSGGDEPPPAGTAPAPPDGVTGWRPLRSGMIRCVTEMETRVKSVRFPATTVYCGFAQRAYRKVIQLDFSFGAEGAGGHDFRGRYQREPSELAGRCH